jgi:hypothetical protein
VRLVQPAKTLALAGNPGFRKRSGGVMEIQRVKFLLLASALAAPACVSTVSDDNAGSGTGGSSGASTGGGQNGTGGKSGGTSTGGSATGGASTGGANTGGAKPDASTGGSDAAAGGKDGSAGSAGDGGIHDGAISIDVNRPDAGTCDDTVRDPGGNGDCSTLQADACAVADFQVAQCSRSATTMKAFIAQQTIQCILDNAAACEPLKTYNCKDTMLKFACPDPTAATDCDRIHLACPSASVDECKAYLNGMTQAGRNSMVTCMETDCFSLYSCVESL